MKLARLAETLKANFTCIVLFILLIVLNTVFFVGVNFKSDLEFTERITQSSQFLFSSDGFVTDILRVMGGARNVLYFLPTLVLFQIFGPSQIASLLFSFSCYLISTILIWKISIKLFDQKAGFASVFLWSVFPLALFYSTGSIAIWPKTALFLLVVFGLILHSQKIGAGSIYVIAGLAGLAMFEPLMLPGVLSLCLVMTAKIGEHKIRKSWIVFFTGILLFSTLIFGLLDNNFFDVFSFLRKQPEFLILLPLILIAMVFASESKKQSNLGFMFISSSAVLLSWFLRISALNLSSLSLESEGTYLIALFAPLLILIGASLAHSLSEKTMAKGLPFLSAIIGLIAILASVGAKDFLPSLDGFDWIGIHSLILFLGILSGIAFIIELIYPFLLKNIARHKESITQALMLLVALSSLYYTWDRREDHYSKIEASHLMAEFLNAKGVTSSLFTISDETRRIISLELGLDNHQLSHSSISDLEDSDQIQEGYLVVFEDEIPALPQKWHAEARLGPLGHPRLVLYQFRSEWYASEELETQLKSEASERDVFKSAIMAGEFCLAYRDWLSSTAVGSHTLQFIELNPETDCLHLSANEVSLDNLIEGQSGNLTFRKSVEGGSEILEIEQRNLPIFDQRISSVPLSLEPNSLYIYSVDLMTEGSTIVLYLTDNQKEDHLEMNSFPDWTTKAVLIATPDWKGPQTIEFSPVLFDHLHSVRIRNFFIGKVELVE